MKRQSALIILISIALVVAGFTVLARREEASKQSDNNRPNVSQTYFAIPEWGINIPADAFGARPAVSYLIGRFADSPSEAIVFFDRPLADIQSSIGETYFKQLVSCLSYTPSISRSPSATNAANNTNNSGVPQNQKGRELDGFRYEPITPQATCPTATEDYPATKIGNYMTGLSTETDQSRIEQVINSITK